MPHLPSLDIRDGALDYLFNVYKRVLPSLGDYITNHGGQVNLSHVDVILAEVGSIEDYVFTMKHENEQRQKERREQFNARKKKANGRSLEDPRTAIQEKQPPKVKGRAARILEKQKSQVALKKEIEGKIQSSHMKSRDNLQAAIALKKSLEKVKVKNEEGHDVGTNETKSDRDTIMTTEKIECDGSKVKKEEDDCLASNETENDVNRKDGDTVISTDKIKGEKKRKFEKVGSERKEENNTGIGEVGDIKDEFDEDDEDEDEAEAVSAFKERVKKEQQMKLDEYARTVEDKVRLHETGWKDRYYSDKCKADDVANHGGRDHLFRSYIIGLCWVMKYYYEGCKFVSYCCESDILYIEFFSQFSSSGPSWKWYYPFHYAPFASDLRNIERFQNDVKSLELSTPFSPVEQLMAVLPSDSSHAIPKSGRWLMSDLESPIIDFYPSEVPVDPNGKAMPWLWVVLLPFIAESRLLAAM